MNMIMYKKKEIMFRDIKQRIEKLHQIVQIINYQIIQFKQVNIHYLISYQNNCLNNFQN